MKMKIVKILPKSQRAKNRVNEHGDQMELIFDRKEAFLVESINYTWRNSNDEFERWKGWFTKEEAAWENI